MKVNCPVAKKEFSLSARNFRLPTSTLESYIQVLFGPTADYYCKDHDISDLPFELRDQTATRLISVTISTG